MDIFLITCAAVLLCIVSSSPFTDDNRKECLRKSILFYEALRSGPLPPHNRVPWRGDSFTGDVGYYGRDLSGGWSEGSSDVKMNFPMAAAVTLLAWGLVEFEDAYRTAGQLHNALDSIEWPLRYFTKCHDGNEFYGQVGDVKEEYRYWGRPENNTNNRPALKLDPSRPGSDLIGETAAAMAAASIAFRNNGDVAYADELLQEAVELYQLADSFRGKYSDHIDTGKMYKSSHFEDELCWAALWLYRAAGETQYLDKAKLWISERRYLKYNPWAFSWNDKVAGIQLLYYMLTKDTEAKQRVRRNLHKWIYNRIRTTPQGLRYRRRWGSLRYAANMAFLALVAAKNNILVSEGREFALSQIDYMMGSSGQSYVVGWGAKSPQQPRNKAASCSPDFTIECNWEDYRKSDSNPSQLTGALVSGPSGRDKFIDNRKLSHFTKVAVDFNAGFQSALAGLLDYLVPPATQPPAKQPPATQTPAAEPPATQPPATQPPATQPPATQPPATQPPATQPPATQPPATQPPATQPPATQPPATQPPVTQPPATQPPATQPPATQPPATQPPATQPPATQPPATQPPATQPPATQPPATQPPATQPPATQPPATQPPATQPPATQPPATQPPTTQPPAIQPPTTQPPATQPPATQPPATQPPATQPPATQPPATQPPATQPPATQPPATQPPATQPPATQTPATPSPSTEDMENYRTVLHKSLLFYEAQRSGVLPANNRINWRGDSALGDQGENGEDLTGGWYDAGDHVKFNLPMAWSTTVLAWGMIEFTDAYSSAGELQNALDCIRWPLDYFIKCHVEDNKLYAQVGDGHTDHKYWGRPEDMTMERPSYYISASKPGSDIAAETAAAMAASSIVFQNSDPAYAALLLTHARALYNFAETYLGAYSDAIPVAADFYKSNKYEDELVWGALWLYRATGETQYLTKAAAYPLPNWPSWGFSWASKQAGCRLLYHILIQDTTQRDIFDKYITNWQTGANGIVYTNNGLAFRSEWGPNRYAANTAFLAIVGSKYGLPGAEFAQEQIGYMLGDSHSKNNRSFVIGFGNNFPLRPHHRASSCPNKPGLCSDIGDSDPNPHVLEGALVGGPASDDSYKDDRKDYMQSEVACDYNAGFQGAVAGLLDALI